MLCFCDALSALEGILDFANDSEHEPDFTESFIVAFVDIKRTYENVASEGVDRCHRQHGIAGRQQVIAHDFLRDQCVRIRMP